MATVKEILQRMASPTMVAYHCRVSPSAVCRWYERGIPVKHWNRVIRLCDSSPDELHDAHRKLHGARKAKL